MQYSKDKAEEHCPAQTDASSTTYEWHHLLVAQHLRAHLTELWLFVAIGGTFFSKLRLAATCYHFGVT